MELSPLGVVQLSNPEDEILRFSVEEPEIFHDGARDAFVASVEGSGIIIPASARPLLRVVLSSLEEQIHLLLVLKGNRRYVEALLRDSQTRCAIIRHSRRACELNGARVVIRDRKSLPLVA